MRSSMEAPFRTTGGRGVAHDEIDGDLIGRFPGDRLERMPEGIKAQPRPM